MIRVSILVFLDFNEAQAEEQKKRITEAFQSLFSWILTRKESCWGDKQEGVSILVFLDFNFCKQHTVIIRERVSILVFLDFNLRVLHASAPTAASFQSLFSWILTESLGIERTVFVVEFQSLFSWILTQLHPPYFLRKEEGFQSLFSWILTYKVWHDCECLCKVSILVFLDFNTLLRFYLSPSRIRRVSILVFLDFNEEFGWWGMSERIGFNPCFLGF